MPSLPLLLGFDVPTPLPAISIYLHLPILIVVISLVYSATRYDEWGPILREALRWGLRLAAFLVFIAVILFALASWIS
jgi:phosphoglycerol transferase MdoB-like AlkP superfamily enzyme